MSCEGEEGVLKSYIDEGVEAIFEILYSEYISTNW